MYICKVPQGPTLPCRQSRAEILRLVRTSLKDRAVLCTTVTKAKGSQAKGHRFMRRLFWVVLLLGAHEGVVIISGLRADLGNEDVERGALMGRGQNCIDFTREKIGSVVSHWAAKTTCS